MLLEKTLQQSQDGNNTKRAMRRSLSVETEHNKIKQNLKDVEYRKVNVKHGFKIQESRWGSRLSCKNSTRLKSWWSCENETWLEYEECNKMTKSRVMKSQDIIKRSLADLLRA